MAVLVKSKFVVPRLVGVGLFKFEMCCHNVTYKNLILDVQAEVSQRLSNAKESASSRNVSVQSHEDLARKLQVSFISLGSLFSSMTLIRNKLYN